MGGIIYSVINNKIFVEIIVYVVGCILVSIIAQNLKNIGFGKYKRQLTFENLNRKNNMFMEYNSIALGISAIAVISVLVILEIYLYFANYSNIVVIGFYCLMHIGIIRNLIYYSYGSQVLIVVVMVVSQGIFYICMQREISEVLNYSKKKLLYYYFQCVLCYLPIFLSILGVKWKIALIMYIAYFVAVIVGLMYYSDMRITKLKMRTNIFLTVGDNILGLSSKNVKRKDNLLMIIKENGKIEIPYDKIKRIESFEENFETISVDDSK